MISMVPMIRVLELGLIPLLRVAALLRITLLLLAVGRLVLAVHGTSKGQVSAMLCPECSSDENKHQHIASREIRELSARGLREI
jgi:hypothetical protein